MQHYGGDADISYNGFVVLTDEQLAAFNDILTLICETHEKIHLHMDCDDNLPSIFRKGDTYKTFDSVFKSVELTRDEFDSLNGLFGLSGAAGLSGFIDYGNTEAFTYVWDSDEFYAKYKSLHRLRN